jgi:hypothetical protein
MFRDFRIAIPAPFNLQGGKIDYGNYSNYFRELPNQVHFWNLLSPLQPEPLERDSAEDIVQIRAFAHPLDLLSLQRGQPVVLKHREQSLIY